MARKKISKGKSFELVSSDEDSFTFYCSSSSTVKPLMLKEGTHQVIVRELEEGGEEDHRYVFEVNISFLKDSQDPSGVVVSYEDLTKLEELERQMSKVKDLLGIEELAASAAHEIRNPLTSLRGFLQLLDLGFSQEDPRGKYVKVMISEIDRISRLLNNFLSLPKEWRRQHQVLSVRDLILDVLGIFKFRFLTSKVTCQVDILENDPLEIMGDRDSLIQVLTNLLQNSLEVTGEDKNIYVKAHRQNGDVVLEVADEGDGVDETILDKLFTPFFTTKGQGTGLGLYVTKQIVETHGGSIYVESKPGQGTAFYVKIPSLQ